MERVGAVDRTRREALHVLDSVRPGPSERIVHRLEAVHLRGLLTMLADDRLRPDVLVLLHVAVLAETLEP